MSFTKDFRGLKRLLLIRHPTRRKIKPTLYMLVVLCSFFTIILLIDDCMDEDDYLIAYKDTRYLFVRPSSLLKELFPGENWIPFKYMSVDEEFRYPLEINMVDLAERRLRKEVIHTRVINEHPFHYIHDSNSLCDLKAKDSDLPLLILIKSASHHHNLREVIRQTWGKKVKSKGRYKMAFLTGYVRQYQDIIDYEQYVYQDIIQEDFIDAYWNNTYKTIMAFNWASQYCSNARTVLFLDDDMFVNLENLEIYVSEIDGERNQNLFSGILAERGIPVRNRRSKWFVPWHDYPYDFYPKYLGGSAIFASMSVVKRFQVVFPYVRYFGIDDVYLGIVACKLKIVPTLNLNLDNNLRNFQNLSFLIANHGFDDYDLYLRTYYNLVVKEYGISA